jgi:hypothetical protein
MDEESFQQLCRDVCASLDLSDIDELEVNHQITLEGVDIGLFYDPFDVKDRIVCYIDIGHVPDIDSEEILEKILAINLLSGSKTSGVYGLDRSKNKIIFVQHFLFPELLTGEILAEIFRGYAQHAKSAQKTFLDVFNNAPLSDLLEQSLTSSSLNLA